MSKIHLLLSALTISGIAMGQSFSTDSATGEVTTAVKMDSSKRSPASQLPDPYGHPLTTEGKTNVPLDAKSLAAKAYQEEAKRNDEEAARLAALNQSIRLDLITGQQEKVLKIGRAHV